MFKSYDDMLEDLERDMRRMSDDILLQMFRMSSTSGDVWTPRVDVYETVDTVIVKVCVAGLIPEQLELTISGDSKYLILRGVRTEHDEDRVGRIRYHQLEIYYGPFERVVQLPLDVPIDRDKLSAAYKDGYLKVTLPKLEISDVKKIQIECDL